MRTLPCLSLMIALGFAAAPAGAQTVPGDVRHGRDLSERFCVNCHSVKSEPAATVSSDVLSFPSIAKQPGTTAERLAGRIIIPHPAMPGVQLTVRELRDIIAYIMSLKPDK